MEEELKLAFRAMSRPKQVTSVGTVAGVQGDTCTVERTGLPPLEEVRLNAVVGDFSSFLKIFPKAGSEVLCLEIENNPAETCIVAYTEIERIEADIDGVVFKLEKGKIQVKNDNADLKLLLTELLTELKKAVIQTPSGVGNFAPPNVAKFTELETKTKQLFE